MQPARWRLATDSWVSHDDTSRCSKASPRQLPGSRTATAEQTEHPFRGNHNEQIELLRVTSPSMRARCLAYVIGKTTSGAQSKRQF